MTTTTNPARPAPRWTVAVAHAIPLLLLPQCLWRLPFGFNFDMGMIDPLARPFPWWGIGYVLALSAGSEAMALLSFGLVRGWGEVAPHWLPLVGGRRIPPFVAIVPATVGGLAVTALWGSLPLAWLHVLGLHALGYTNVWWQVLAMACVAPAMLWGPLLLALTYAYYVRRCRG